jgi:hypothetical protein
MVIFLALYESLIHRLAGIPAAGKHWDTGLFAADAARISRLGYSAQAGTTCGRDAGRGGRTGSSGSKRASADAVAIALIITALPSDPRL